MRALVIVTALSLLGFPALALAGGDGLNLIPNLTLLVANLVVFGLLIYPTQRWLLAPLVAASTLLYASGVVLNDVFDLRRDARERPERPLPSRRVSLPAARRLQPRRRRREDRRDQ